MHSLHSFIISRSLELCFSNLNGFQTVRMGILRLISAFTKRPINESQYVLCAHICLQDSHTLRESERWIDAKQIHWQQRHEHIKQIGHQSPTNNHFLDFSQPFASTASNMEMASPTSAKRTCKKNENFMAIWNLQSKFNKWEASIRQRKTYWDMENLFG